MGSKRHHETTGKLSTLAECKNVNPKHCKKPTATIKYMYTTPGSKFCPKFFYNNGGYRRFLEI